LVAPLADAKQLELRYLVDPPRRTRSPATGAVAPDPDQPAVERRPIYRRGEIEVNLAGACTRGRAPLWDIISVRDTGTVSPARLNHIFQPFEQASAAITRQYGGSGLGLTISRRLGEQLARVSG
jgi:signal transduction histidine kinase